MIRLFTNNKPECSVRLYDSLSISRSYMYSKTLQLLLLLLSLPLPCEPTTSTYLYTQYSPTRASLKNTHILKNSRSNAKCTQPPFIACLHGRLHGRCCGHSKILILIFTCVEYLAGMAQWQNGASSLRASLKTNNTHTTVVQFLQKLHGTLL